MYEDKKFENFWGQLEARQEKMLAFLDESDISLMDLGAGQMYIKNRLPPHMKYYPVDYIKRFPEMIVCDFNKSQFPCISVDVAFCSGILEWIDNYEWFISEVCQHSTKIIISYAILDCFPNLSQRQEYGWVNHLREQDLIQLFRANKRNCQDMSFDYKTQQPIYLFKK